METGRATTNLRINTKDRVNSRHRGPLSVEKCLQSSPSSTQQSKIQSDKQAVLNTFVEDRYELIEIQLTIYNFSGVCGAREKRIRKKRSTSTASALRGSKLLPFVNGGTGRFHVPSVSESAESMEGPKEDGVPITAVVSCHRNAISSTTTLETYLPSLPLVPASLTGPGCFRYQASWVHKNLSRQGPLNTEACTFKILRAMKREGYRPGLNIEEVYNYAPETIHLNVHLGHRQDLIPLGVASVAVTGEEEIESILNVPVKLQATSTSNLASGRRHHSKRSRMNQTKPFFPHDAGWIYSLADNATLRVGIRTLPVPAEAKKVCGNQRQVRSKPLQFIGDCVIELDGASSLTAHLSLANSKVGFPTKEDLTADAVKARSPSFPSRLFCLPDDFVCSEAINLLPAALVVPSDDNESKGREYSKVGERMVPKKQSGLMSSLPISLFSSLSVSTDDSEDKSNSKSVESFGESHLRSVQRVIEANLYGMQQKIVGEGENSC